MDGVRDFRCTGGVPCQLRRYHTGLFGHPCRLVGVVPRVGTPCPRRSCELTTPKGTRTPVLAVRGLCPRPLDDGGLVYDVANSDRQEPVKVRCGVFTVRRGRGAWPRFAPSIKSSQGMSTPSEARGLASD